MNKAEQRQTEEAGGWLAAIVESSDDAIIGTTLDGVITSWNPGAQKLYGYSAQEAIGRSISILVPPDHLDEVPKIVEKISWGKGLDRYETVHVRKNGRQLEVSIIVSSVKSSEGSAVGACVLAHDITERKRAEERQRLLAEASQVFSGLVADYEALLQRIAEHIAEATGDACTVRLLSDDGRWLRPVAGHHPDPELTSAIWAVMQETVERSNIGVWQPVIQEQRTVRMAVSPQEIPRDASQEQAEFMRRYPMSAIMGAPLVAQGRILGGVSLVRYGRHLSPYTEEEEAFLRDLADRAALVIDNALLYRATEKELTKRGEVEKGLEASEERFRATFEQVAVGMAHVEVDGSWLRANHKLCEITGYTEDELLEKTFQDITHPEDLGKDLEQARKLLDGEIETYSMEKRYLRKDGSIVWVNLTGSLVRKDSGEPKYFIAVIEDISDRKRVEEALRTSHKDLEDLKFAIDESAIVAFTDQKGKITHVNEKFCQISKYSREELLGQDHRIINSGYHKKEYIRNLWSTIAQGRVWRGELRNRARDGSIYWVDTTIVPFLNERGKPYRYVAIRHDITSRKQAEQRLQDTLERLLALHEGGQVLGSSLQREEIGSRLLETMHRTSDLTVAAIEMVDEQGLPSMLCTLGEEGLLRRARSTQEAQDIRREALESGERRSLELHAPSGAEEAPLFAGLYLPLRVRERSIGVVEAYGPPDLLEQEITETLSGLANQAASALDNAHLYEELAERERRLRELVRQILKAQEEERRRVAYEVHDGLAQVAAAAHQYLQGFAKRYSPESATGREELKEALELIQQAVREARQIIANLRPTALDDFGLAVALRLHAEELSAAEELQVGFEETLGHQRLPQEAETTLFRVAQEALTNAKKHAQSSRVLVRLERQEGSVRLEVRDWGRGFEVSEVTNGGGGPGERVGISGMRERIALLGGELAIDSQPAVGTTVIAEIPLVEGEDGSHGN